VAGCLSTIKTETNLVFDPAGTYDVTMASQGMVSEGAMTIYGVPGRYRGSLSIGGMSAEMRRVELDDNTLTFEAKSDQGNLVVRLVRDGSFFSGNWVMGARRGTFTAEVRSEPAADPLLRFES